MSQSAHRTLAAPLESNADLGLAQADEDIRPRQRLELGDHGLSGLEITRRDGPADACKSTCENPAAVRTAICEVGHARQLGQRRARDPLQLADLASPVQTAGDQGVEQIPGERGGRSVGVVALLGEDQAGRVVCTPGGNLLERRERLGHTPDRRVHEHDDGADRRELREDVGSRPVSFERREHGKRSRCCLLGDREEEPCVHHLGRLRIHWHRGEEPLRLLDIEPPDHFHDHRRQEPPGPVEISGLDQRVESELDLALSLIHGGRTRPGGCSFGRRCVLELLTEDLPDLRMQPQLTRTLVPDTWNTGRSERVDHRRPRLAREGDRAVPVDAVEHGAANEERILAGIEPRPHVSCEIRRQPPARRRIPAPRLQHEPGDPPSRGLEREEGIDVEPARRDDRLGLGDVGLDDVVPDRRGGSEHVRADPGDHGYEPLDEDDRHPPAPRTYERGENLCGRRPLVEEMSIVDHQHELAVSDDRPDRAGQLTRILALPLLEHRPDSGNRLGYREDEVTEEPTRTTVPVLQCEPPHRYVHVGDRLRDESRLARPRRSNHVHEA